MVDSPAPFGSRSEWVAAAEHHVTSIQAEADVGPPEHFFDLFAGFDIAGAVMVERRFITALPAEAGRARDALGKMRPAGGVQAQ